jgi:hypothetical protein
MRIAVRPCVVLAVALAVANCAADDDHDKNTSAMRCGTDAGDDAASGTGQSLVAPTHSLAIVFLPMYSAYIDEAHPCRIPATATGAKGKVRWLASEPGMVEFEQATPGSPDVMITTRRPGTVDIVALDDCTGSGNSTLTITPFTVEEWEAGKARYDNGVAYAAPTMESIMAMLRAAQEAAKDAGLDADDDGGVSTMPSWGLPLNANLDKAACTNCHGKDATMLSIEATPQQIGGYSDDDIVEIIAHGRKPQGAPSVTVIPQLIFQQFHTWDAVDPSNEKQRNGIIAYLRSLEPAAQPPPETN